MKQIDLSLILLSVFLSASAQLAMKVGVNSANASSSAHASAAAIDRLLAFATSPLLILGLALYAGSAAFWIVVLSRVDLSLAYPFVGLGFILTSAAGFLLLGEAVSPARIFGTGLIAVGAYLVARSA
jgi:multidrug transporter EmrE-like cation transporter